MLPVTVMCLIAGSVVLSHRALSKDAIAVNHGVVTLGNLVAIVLEGIIASVQALRLEYYEFFGKFFSGSGQPFKPFRLAANGLTWKETPS